MVRRQFFSEKDYRQDSAKDRHEMDERPGDIGAEHGYRTVPEDEGQYRGKYRYVDNGHNRSAGKGHGPAGGYFQKIEWQEDCQTDEHDAHLVGKGMQSFRVFLQIGGIKRPAGCGDKYQNIPPVEAQLQQCIELALGDNQYYPAKRYCHAEILSETEPVVVHCPGKKDNDDRRAGVDQHRIDGGGGLDRQINEAVEPGYPKDALHDDKFAVRQDKTALGQEMAEAETGKNQQRHRPSPE